MGFGSGQYGGSAKGMMSAGHFSRAVVRQAALSCT
jgi:hypothetical protein